VKPWPAALAEHYPFHSADEDRHPIRPWWRKADLTAKHRASHRGLAVHIVPRPGWLRTDGKEVNSSQSDNAQLAIFDLDCPVPRPSLRVGQIWADEHGRAVTLLSAFAGQAVCMENVQLTAMRSDGHMSYYGEQNVIRNFRSDVYEFLVYDPCCPWLAPWAPASAS
jgi:hypothetical protein